MEAAANAAAVPAIPAPAQAVAAEPLTIAPLLGVPVPAAPESSEPAFAASVAPSLADDTVAEAPDDDPFLLSLFAAEEEPVHPEAIPIVEGTKVRGSRRVARAARRAQAAEPKVRITKLPRSARKANKANAAKASKSRPASTLLSIGALLFSGALLVGTTVPANAFITFADEPVGGVNGAVVSDTGPEQTVEVAADAAVSALTRDAFSVTSYAEVVREKYGTRISTFTPTTGAVRWPFPYATPISSGFGDRVAPCRGCSSHHNGVDFTPGVGTPIYAIADGVVTASEFSGSFGQHVYMDHVVNGQKVESIYGHMLAGSSPLVAGQTVKVGDLIGLVGSTGASTGAHLHLEVHLDGVVVDPFAWLQANAVN
jgi:murein DD-endopeptidase MepM/ murein hydrolase activator NlpD